MGTQCHLNVMKIVRCVMGDFMEPVGMEIGANQMMFLALMHAVLPCHLNVMQIVMFVPMELICMDAGWGIFVSQVMCLVLMNVLLQRLLNVMLIVKFAIWELICMDAGWETFAIQENRLVQLLENKAFSEISFKFLKYIISI